MEPASQLVRSYGVKDWQSCRPFPSAVRAMGLNLGFCCGCMKYSERDQGFFLYTSHLDVISLSCSQQVSELEGSDVRTDEVAVR